MLCGVTEIVNLPMRINSMHHTKSKSDSFLQIKNLLKQRLKLIFVYKITLWISVCVLLNSQRLYRRKKLVLNVGIKASLYTKHIFIYRMYIFVYFYLCFGWKDLWEVFDKDNPISISVRSWMCGVYIKQEQKLSIRA